MTDIHALVTDDKAGTALQYLSDTDDECARLHALVKAKEKEEKVVIAMGFDAKEGSAEARRQAAHHTTEYRTWLEQYETALVDYQIMKFKRERNILACELWRSVNSNRNRGNVR